LFSLCLSFAEATRVTLEKSHSFALVEDWTDLGPSRDESIHHVGFSMKISPTKRDALEAFFWEVSDPNNPFYGQYISREELVERYIGAQDEDLKSVAEFLSASGAVNVQIGVNRDIVFADATISNLESILDTEFHSFHSNKYKLTVNRVISPYSLPADIASKVALVDNIAVFPGIMTATFAEQPVGAASWPNFCPGGSACAGKITPNITAQIYNSFPLTSNFKVAEGNGMAIAEFQGQKYDLKDLTNFGAGCNIPTVVVKDVNGNGVGLTGGIETMLDIEYISGNGLGIPLSNFYYQDYSLLAFATQVNAQTGVAPLVYSVSYGNDEVQQTSTDYMYQCNTAFMGSATLGFSVLFASGDQGVWGRSGVGLKFHPDFPASSPYITAVGGTDFKSISPSLTSHDEDCSTDGGGGFSNTFGIPSYQAAAVQGYIALAQAAGNLPPQSYWNATGRAYPDISADFGAKVPYCILANGAWEGVGGTSASCPTVAHGIAVLNNIQLAAGKPALGFLNPWLYATQAAHPDAFTDVTAGMNNQNLGKGFTANVGWDPCSGVGTPDFAAMSKYLP